MLEELRWKTSLSATALHAALCRAREIPAADAALGELLNPPADALVAEIAAAEWPPLSLLEQLTALASEFDNNRELVTRAAAKLHLPARDPALLVRIAGGIADLEAVLLRAQPNLAEELAVRCGPLREQWEARGPGMLREIARSTEETVIPVAAEIVLVAPYAGGNGVAHAGQNRVTFEGVLFHPLPALPEPVRLAWLLSQLNADLPRYADLLPAGRGPDRFAVAMLAPALAAAQEVELAVCDEASLASAFEAWGLGTELPNDAPERVWNWWNVWLDQPATWPVAVAALDRLLA
ncbi:MAG: hypothetical protein C0485_01460 [Pirellula sp.]|nr:hypothetical protein [Pirellula sp.]